MKIAFPVYYGIDGRLPGKKAARTYSFREFLEVDIQELSEEQAPVACVWSPGAERREYEDRPYQTNNGQFDDQGNQVTRWYDGRHWKRILLSECAGDTYRIAGLPPLDQRLASEMLLKGCALGTMGVSCDCDFSRP
jgi:hypothetical protein